MFRISMLLWLIALAALNLTVLRGCDRASASDYATLEGVPFGVVP